MVNYSMEYCKVTWSSKPPKFELQKNNVVMLFYNSEQYVEENEHYDQEQLNEAQSAAYAKYKEEYDAAMEVWNAQEAERQSKIRAEIDAAMESGEIVDYSEIEAKYPAIPEPVIDMPEIDYSSIDKVTDYYDKWACYTVRVQDEKLHQLLSSNPESIQAQKEIANICILAYDSSEFVNRFTIGDFSIWLDKETRVGLKLRFDSEVLAGKTETTLWQNGMPITLPLTGDNSAFNMLAAIELYASACYDNTQAHISEMNRLETAEEVAAYDYTASYPQKLSF